MRSGSPGQLLNCLGRLGPSVQLGQSHQDYRRAAVEKAGCYQIARPIPDYLRAITRIDSNIRVGKKSWLSSDLPQLLPANLGDTLPVSDRFQNLSFCAFSTRASAVYAPQNNCFLCLLTSKDVARFGSWNDDTLFVVCSHRHGGIIPLRAPQRQAVGSQWFATVNGARRATAT
jgi:hypothetical protein